MKTLLTTKQKYTMADAYIDLVSNTNSCNLYLGIGRVLDWANSGVSIPEPDESTDTINTIYRSLVALKRITATNLSLVVRRIDWTTGTVYDAYDNTVDMFSTIKLTQANGVANCLSSNTVNGNSSSTYTTDFSIGSIVRFSGDGRTIPYQDKEIVAIPNSANLVLNTATSYSYTSNIIYKVTDSFPQYAKKFYVRNTKDQVFKCLFNSSNASSTVMPEISLGGELPESAYIETSDGYKWKYLYTIPSSYKKQFLTPEWMPVSRDQFVMDAAVDGAIDIVKIVKSGNNYNSNVATNTATILSVSGDGTGANLSARIDSSGRITGINILNSGYGYTTAAVSATGGDGTASLVPVIGPNGGHGFDPASELGASTISIAVELDKDEGGTIPTQGSIGDGTTDFDYHQITILKDPLLTTGYYANNSNYRVTNAITVSTLPAGEYFYMDETVYQGSSLATATFTASVVNFNSSASTIYVNNITGTFVANEAIRGTVQSTAVSAFDMSETDIELFTGKILYINNIESIARDPNQAEQIKLTLSFK